MQKTENKILTASQILIKIFEKLGIRDVFGYPGGTVVDLYDEIQQSSIKHYLMQCEQSVVHAAEGYSRVSERCGVGVVTAGPGALNTVTGLANAYLDGFPMLLIAGDINSSHEGKDAFQEVNFPEIVKSCVKYVFKISDVEELESTVLQAYLIAMSGKKGPVVIDIPSDIFKQKTEYKDLGLPSDKVETVSDIDVTRAIEILKNAKSPLIVCGGGVFHSKASRELEKLAEYLNIPVVTTMMGVSSFSSENSLCAGMIGVFGHKTANKLLKNADTLLVLGARFNDRVVLPSELENLNSKTIIQVDINSKELIRNLSSDLAVNADIKMFLNLLLAKIRLESISDFVYEYKDNLKFIEDDESGKITSKTIASTVGNLLTGCLIATDVGQHQISVIKNCKFNFPGQLLTSGGLGTMGFGFGAAIGASIATGGKPVALFTGDGSFQMSLAELAVCKRYGIPIKIFVINNGELGLVRQLQDKLFDGRHPEISLCNPDFALLAGSYGINAERVENYSEISASVQRAFSENKPYLIDFIISESEIV